MMKQQTFSKIHKIFEDANLIDSMKKFSKLTIEITKLIEEDKTILDSESIDIINEIGSKFYFISNYIKGINNSLFGISTNVDKS